MQEREHVVNPETGRCIWCGKNAHWREHSPKCETFMEETQRKIVEATNGVQT